MGRREVAENASIARSRVAALGSSDAGAGEPPAALAPGGAEWPPGADVIDAERGWRGWMPAAVRDAALGPGRRGVRALAAVAVLVALVAGLVAWRARPDAEPVATASILDAPSAAPSASASPAAVVVAVSGKVRRPGLVRLPAGARVADAVQAAGGVLPGADLSALNFARKVVDGELIAVGVPAPVGAGSSAAAGPAEPGAPLDLNAATTEQFDALPGVGPVLAERIVAWRTEHGGFRSVDQLREVEGIGDTRFEKLRELVRV